MLRKVGKGLAKSLSLNHSDLDQSQPQGTGFAESLGTLQMSMKRHSCPLKGSYPTVYVVFLNLVRPKEGWLGKKIGEGT